MKLPLGLIEEAELEFLDHLVLVHDFPSFPSEVMYGAICDTFCIDGMTYNLEQSDQASNN